MTAARLEQPRTVHVEHCMGTVFSLDIRDAGSWDTAIAEVVRWLHRVDAVFSTYRSDSDLSRIRRGELPVSAADPLVATVLDLCGRMEARTQGYFSPTWGGELDPTGLVKGWAIEHASRLLVDAGSSNHSVNGGGDVQVRGESAPGQPWRVGISDPLDRTRILAVVAGRDLAVASSGIAERGEHILDPHTGRPSIGLTGVTVVGPALTSVDTYATAAFAMGDRALEWLEALPGHEGLVVSASGARRSTTGFPALAGPA